jgi:hypothetical protein
MRAAGIDKEFAPKSVVSKKRKLFSGEGACMRPRIPFALRPDAYVRAAHRVEWPRDAEDCPKPGRNCSRHTAGVTPRTD